MKTLKSNKIILLITAIAMFVCAALCQLSSFIVFADAKPTSYFSFSGGTEAKYIEALEGDYKVNESIVEYGALFTVKANDTIKLLNKVVVDDLGIKVVLDKNIEKFTVSLKAASYDVNGNVLDDKFDKEIVTELEVSIADKIDSKGVMTIEFGVDDSYLTAGFNGGEKAPIADVTNDYYKIRHVDKTAVELSIKINSVKDSKTVDFVVTDINQMVTDENKAYDYSTNQFNQSFKLNKDKTDLLNKALPRVAIEDEFFTNTKDDEYTICKQDGALYTVDLNAYSVAKAYSNSDIILVGEDTYTGDAFGVTVSTESNSDRIIFNLKNGVVLEKDSPVSMNFYIATKVDDKMVKLESHTAKVFNETIQDEQAPEYKLDADGNVTAEIQKRIDSFQEALTNASKKTTEGYGEHSINLGDRITIPSLENFVTDNYSSYNKLTKTIHLITPSKEDKTSTSSSIQIDEAGLYKLYVTFKDENGQEMSKDDFIPSEENEENPKYGAFVFDLEIEDNAPLIINNDKEQENGYVGVKYKATSFEIKAKNYNKTYTLWYSSNLNAKADDTSWKQIKTISEFRTDSSGDYSEEEIKNIAYDGELSFKPDKKGSYKITCVVSSDKSYRSEQSDTIIRVASEPTIVKPISDWLKNNVWSVVFLSVGTVCLIAIVVLLCIKPKDKNIEE